MYLHQGLKITASLTINGINYPPEYWAQATPEQLTALGVSYAPDPVWPDPLLYNATENPDGTLTVTPKTQAELDAQLQVEKTYHIAQLNAACQAAIVGGFSSSALGAPHTYDSSIEDQLNLIGAVSLASATGADTPYKCTNAGGIKDYHLHTVAQIKQVLVDGGAYKQTLLHRLFTLKQQVQAATTSAQVDAVIW